MTVVPIGRMIDVNLKGGEDGHVWVSPNSRQVSKTYVKDWAVVKIKNTDHLLPDYFYYMIQTALMSARIEDLSGVAVDIKDPEVAKHYE